MNLLQKINSQIDVSTFDAGLKEQIRLILPNLGQALTFRLWQLLSRNDSKLFEDDIVKNFNLYSNLYKGIKSKDFEAKNLFLREINTEWVVLDEDRQKDYLAFVLDVYKLFQSNSDFLNKEELELLLSKICFMFSDLSKDDLLYVVSNNLVYLLDNIDLISEMQLSAYLGNWTYVKGFTKRLVDSVQANKEVIDIATKSTIEFVIKEFIAFSKSALDQRNLTDISSFLVKHPVISKFDSTAKKRVSEVLKLQMWLLQPGGNEASIEAYWESKNQTRARQFNEFFEADLNEFLASQGEQEKQEVATQSFTPNVTSEPILTNPVIEKPKTPEVKKIEREDVKPEPKPVSKNLPPKVVPPIQPAPILSGNRSVNIQEILKRKQENQNSNGNSSIKNIPSQFVEPNFSQGTNLETKNKNNESKSENGPNSVDIDDKLDALRKRKNG